MVPIERGLTPAQLVPYRGARLNATTFKEFLQIDPKYAIDLGLTGTLEEAVPARALDFRFVDAVVGSFLVVMVFILAYKVSSSCYSLLRRVSTVAWQNDQRYWRYNHTRIWPRVKRDLLYAPLWGKRRMRELHLTRRIGLGTIPGRMDTLLLLLYYISNIVYMLILPYSYKDRFTIVSELRGRTGSLAAINLIPTILFALRNNPFIPLLGVSYDTFNLWHRWAARLVVFEGIVHGICWGVNVGDSGSFRLINYVLATTPSYLCALIGLCAFVTIMVQASNPIRHAFYETFINIHRVLVMLGLVTVYIHCDKSMLPQLPYIQLCFALWGAEWVVRSLRIYYHNFAWRSGLSKVTIEALPGDACRVTYHLKRPMEWQPGTHVHAYLPKLSLWASHPFSVAWVDGHLPVVKRQRSLGHEEKGPTLKLRGLPPRDRLLPTMFKSESMDSVASNLSKASTTIDPNILESPEALVHSAPSTGLSNVSLVMRAKEGMTRKLYLRACASRNRTLTTWGALEGPYGGHETLSSYGTVLLFAGGVGITHCLGYMRHLLRQYDSGEGSARRIVLCWTIPSLEALEWVRPWIDEMIRIESLQRPQHEWNHDSSTSLLSIQIYVSQRNQQIDDLHHGFGRGCNVVEMISGRCSARKVLEREMENRIGAVGVTVCGPGAMADDVRAAVRSSIHIGSVDLHEESFSY